MQQQVEADKAKFIIQKISVNDNTDVIMEILKNSMNKHNITELSLASITLDERDGLAGKVLKCSEYVMDSKYGYTSMSLPAEEVELDPVLMGIYEDYRTYLNKVYDQTDKTAGETQKGKIQSRYVLARELLLRSVVSALKIKSNLEHGNNMMNFIDDFIGGLLESQILLDEVFSTENIFTFSIKNKELSPFDIAFSSPGHRDRLNLIRKAIEMSNLIHLPKIAIQQASNYLKQLRHILAAHILVIAKFDIKEEEKIGKDFIQNTFQEFEIQMSKKTCTLHIRTELPEEKCREQYKNSFVFCHNSTELGHIDYNGIIEKVKIKNLDSFLKAAKISHKSEFEGKSLYLSLEKLDEFIMPNNSSESILKKYMNNTLKEVEEKNWHSTKITTSQQRIIDSFKEKQHDERYIKLNNFYSLFAKTNILISLVEYISTLVSGINWVLILIGYINIDKLNFVISKHSEDCKNSLFIDQKIMEGHKGKLSYKSLVKYGLSGNSFSPTTTCNTLSLLNQPEVINKFLEKMKDTIAKLETIDEQVFANFSCNIVNTHTGEKLFSSFDRLESSNLQINSNSKIREISLKEDKPLFHDKNKKSISIKNVTTSLKEITHITSSSKSKESRAVKKEAGELSNSRSEYSYDNISNTSGTQSEFERSISQNKLLPTNSVLNIEHKETISDLNQTVIEKESQLAKQKKELEEREKLLEQREEEIKKLKQMLPREKEESRKEKASVIESVIEKVNPFSISSKQNEPKSKKNAGFEKGSKSKNGNEDSSTTEQSMSKTKSEHESFQDKPKDKNKLRKGKSKSIKENNKKESTENMNSKFESKSEHGYSNSQAMKDIGMFSDKTQLKEPESPELFFERAKGYISLGTRENRKLAINDFTLALEYCDKNEQQLKKKILIERGITFEYLNQPDKAIADYTAILELEPKNVDILIRRGLILSENNKFDEGNKDFELAEKLSPDHEELLWKRSQVCMVHENYEQAVADLTKLCNLYPDNEYAKHRLMTAKKAIEIREAELLKPNEEPLKEEESSFFSFF